MCMLVLWRVKEKPEILIFTPSTIANLFLSISPPPPFFFYFILFPLLVLVISLISNMWVLPRMVDLVDTEGGERGEGRKEGK